MELEQAQQSNVVKIPFKNLSSKEEEQQLVQVIIFGLEIIVGLDGQQFVAAPELSIPYPQVFFRMPLLIREFD